MTSRRALLIVGLGLIVASLVSFIMPRRIDAPEATRIAERLQQRFRSATGQPPARFESVERRVWADGWEFRWRFKPCADIASLRIWISHDGREARYVEIPDCLPQTGFGAGAATV
jgi:hypothetical protein